MKKLWVLFVLLASLCATDAFACQKYFSSVQDSAGNLVGGVSITVTNYGTSIVSAIYSDSSCAADTVNPLTSLTDGSFSFYAQDGHYTLAFIKSGYTIGTVEDVTIVEPLAANIKAVSEFASPDDICGATTGAIAATSTTVRTIWVNAAVSCTADATAPATTSWIFVGKGSVSTSSTKTLTINGPVSNFTDHAVWLGSGTTIFGAGAGIDPYGTLGKIQTVTYSATMTIDHSLGTHVKITPTNGVAFAIALPTRQAVNRPLRIEMINTTGGALGAGTLTGYKIGAAWTLPATGFSRFIDFICNGTTCKEVGRSAADITN